MSDDNSVKESLEQMGRATGAGVGSLVAGTAVGIATATLTAPVAIPLVLAATAVGAVAGWKNPIGIIFGAITRGS